MEEQVEEEGENEEQMSDLEQDDHEEQISKKKLKKMNQMSVAELKQVVAKPDLVEVNIS